MTTQIQSGRLNYHPPEQPKEYALATLKGSAPGYQDSLLFYHQGKSPSSPPTQLVLNFSLVGNYDLVVINEQNPCRSQQEDTQQVIAELEQKLLVLSHELLRDCMILITPRKRSEELGVLCLDPQDKTCKIGLSSNSQTDLLRLQTLVDPFLYSTDLEPIYGDRIERLSTRIEQAYESGIPNPGEFLAHFNELASLRVKEAKKVYDYYQAKKLKPRR